MTTLAVETEGLAKVYGLLTAVDHISFDVRVGEVFALATIILRRRLD